MATSNSFTFIKHIPDDLLMEEFKAPKEEKNVWKEKYFRTLKRLEDTQLLLEENRLGLTQRELRIILNRALKDRGLPLVRHRRVSKTEFANEVSNILFNLVQKCDPDVLP